MIHQWATSPTSRVGVKHKKFKLYLLNISFEMIFSSIFIYMYLALKYLSVGLVPSANDLSVENFVP